MVPKNFAASSQSMQSPQPRGSICLASLDKIIQGVAQRPVGRFVAFARYVVTLPVMPAINAALNR